MLKKKQKLVEKLFYRSQTITAPATQKEAASNVVGETTMERLECTSHAGEVEVPAGSEMAEERLFTVHCASGGNLEHTHMADTAQTADTSHMSNSHRKRRKFKFKKGTVAPQEET